MTNLAPMAELYSDLIRALVTAKYVQDRSKDAAEVSIASVIEQRINLIISELVIEIPALAGSVDFDD